MTKFRRCFFLGLLFVSSTACAQNCQTDNSALQAMPDSLLRFTQINGEVLDFVVRTASNNTTRSAGFQRVCESAIEAKPILFIFDRAITPRFHMNNVVAPIDIAFIDAQGGIESIQAMLPYVLGSLEKPLYYPARPIIAALEVHEGFYAKHNIDSTAVVSWKLATKPSIGQ